MVSIPSNSMSGKRKNDFKLASLSIPKSNMNVNNLQSTRASVEIPSD